MNVPRTWIYLACVGMSAATVLAQARGDRPRAPGPPPTDGFWPTQGMIDIAIERMTRELSREYALDDDQAMNTRDVLSDRLPTWLQENRAELQSLLNEYMETMMGLEPPEPQKMAQWAQRVMPLFQDFSGLVEQTTDDMRSYLTDEQQVLLDGHLAAMNVGMGYMEQRLNVWKEGGYNRYTDWPHGAEYRKNEVERKRMLAAEADRARTDAMGLPPETDVPPGATPPPADETGDNRPQPAAPVNATAKDEWVEYVENFIRRYQLDEAQQNSARKFLREQQELRDKYLRDKLAKINAIEGRLKSAQGEEERESVKAELDRLNKPLELYFSRLKDRLDTLPTRKQRATAAQNEMAARAKAEKPSKGKRPESQPAKTEPGAESKPGQ